jgi:hypothetical protein
VPVSFIKINPENHHKAPGTIVAVIVTCNRCLLIPIILGPVSIKNYFLNLLVVSETGITYIHQCCSAAYSCSLYRIAWRSTSFLNKDSLLFQNSVWIVHSTDHLCKLQLPDKHGNTSNPSGKIELSCFLVRLTQVLSVILPHLPVRLTKVGTNMSNKVAKTVVSQT